jgi:capsular exopolysaccharide synthesis family protein
MNEKPPPSQNLALVNLAGPDAGRPENHHAALMPVSQGPIGPAAKQQPRFVITSVKLREAFLHRWGLAFLIAFVLAGVGAGLACLIYQPKYTATALLRMSSVGSRLLPNGAVMDNLQREEEFRKVQTYWIKSPAILDVVLKKNAIQALNTIRNVENPDAWLEKELKVVSVPMTDIFRISLSGPDPKEITAIVNAVKDEFVRQFVDVENVKQTTRLEDVKKALLHEDTKIDNMKSTLKEMVNKSGSGEASVLNLKQRTLLEEYSMLNRSLLALKVEINSAEALLEVQKGNKGVGSEPFEAILIQEFLEKHPQLQTAQLEVAKAETKIQEYRKKVSSDSPLLIKANGELEVAKLHLEKEKQDLLPEVTKKAKDIIAHKTEADFTATEIKVKVLKQQSKELTKQVKDMYDKADAVGKDSFMIEQMRSELSEMEGVAKKLRGEKEILELERHKEDIDPLSNNALVKGFVPVNQPAVVPTRNEASLLKMGGLFSAIGFVLGLFGVSYFEARVRRLHKPTDVNQELGIKTLGVLPLLAQKEGRAYGQGISVNETPPGVMFTEAVNGVCASLMCDDRLSRGAVLMVTSASENEGKTLLATQLAAGLARTGRRTLLLDGDLRNSRCHEQMGLAAGPGLSEVLRGEADLATALQTIPESEARVLMAGKSDSQVIKALSNGKFAALLAELRQQFDCIIIDSAPTLVVADGLLIGKLVDGVILVVRPKVSKAPAVYSAYEQLTGLHIRTLGAVVNANPTKASSSYYARYS